MSRHHLLILFCLVLAGCSSVKKDDSATIERLEGGSVEVEKDTAVQGGLGKAIQSYHAYLKSAENDALRAEAIRRLADLEMEKTEADHLDSVGRLEKGSVHQTYPAARKLKPADYRNAIKLYQDLLEAYPDYPGNGQVLYQLARAYEESGNYQQSVQILNRLVASYPDARYIDEAQFRRGELLFVMNAYGDAERAYGAVLKIGDKSRFYDKSLYKHGWTLFKQLRYQAALDSFFAVLDRRFTDKTSGKILSEPANLSRGEKELLGDAFRVVTLSFSYLDGEKSVTRYFNNKGSRPYEHKVYEALGELYIKQQRYVDAANAYSEFVRRHANDSRAPLFDVKVMEAYKQGGFPSLLLEAKEEFVVRYGVNSEFWAMHDAATHASVAPHLKANIEDLARHYHAHAQRTKKVPHYRQAARWYTEFVQAFPDDTKTSHMNFLLAETLFEGKLYEGAAIQYEKAAYLYPRHANSAEAGYAALLAYRKREQELNSEEGAEYQWRTITSGLRFADAFPRDERAATVLTKAAEDLFALNALQRAAATARRITDMKPPPKAALRRTAWTIIAHTEFEKGAYEQAELAYRQVLRLTGPRDKKRAELIERLASAIYKQAEQLRAVDDMRGAVAQFLRVKDVAPTSSVSATAEYDAAAGLITLKDWNAAISVLERFRKRYPRHPLQRQVPEKLALAYLESGQWSRAAAQFEVIAAQRKDAQLQQQAMWQAAELYDKAGEKKAAAAAYGRYIRSFPGSFEQAMEARYRLAELYDAAGQKAQHFRWLREMVDAADAPKQERTDRTQYLAAKAAFLLAEPAYQQFRNVRLMIPLKKSLKKKKQKMQIALNAYGRAADYGVAEFTTAATFRIADIYHSLSRDLLASQRPKRLSPEELEQYDVLLEEQAFPFEEKAIEIHEANVQRVVNNVYDEWVKKSFVQLSKLRPVQYAKFEKSELVSNGIE